VETNFFSSLVLAFFRATWVSLFSCKERCSSRRNYIRVFRAIISGINRLVSSREMFGNDGFGDQYADDWGEDWGGAPNRNRQVARRGDYRGSFEDRDAHRRRLEAARRNAPSKPEVGI
jgi:hypothetical protein